ncbi:MAG TPA: hypothetical protein PLR06_02695 [Cyclobacteriaceae bacterium]|nr:hypothetical protein [Cyclobacteriaceae bacterium]
MKKLLAIPFLFVALTVAAQEIPSAENQIKVAVLAAPAEQRDGAMVIGYNTKGELGVLRNGSNELVCLADDPKQKGINVSCYHKDLEPFMARGRELKVQGKSFQEVFDIREAEVKSGKLHMPKQPTTLFVFTADEWDAATGTTRNDYLRSVVYIPYATAESTGLPLKPSGPGMPWIMDPGTHRAHIMISPAKPKPPTQ